jgi:hypothetical protein
METNDSMKLIPASRVILLTFLIIWMTSSLGVFIFSSDPFGPAATILFLALLAPLTFLFVEPLITPVTVIFLYGFYHLSYRAKSYRYRTLALIIISILWFIFGAFVLSFTGT